MALVDRKLFTQQTATREVTVESTDANCAAYQLVHRRWKDESRAVLLRTLEEVNHTRSISRPGYRVCLGRWKWRRSVSLCAMTCNLDFAPRSHLVKHCRCWRSRSSAQVHSPTCSHSTGHILHTTDCASHDTTSTTRSNHRLTEQPLPDPYVAASATI